MGELEPGKLQQFDGLLQRLCHMDLEAQFEMKFLLNAHGLLIICRRKRHYLRGFCRSYSIQLKGLSEINFSHIQIAGKLERRAAAENFPIVYDIRSISYFQCFPYVMVSDEHSDSAVAQLAYKLRGRFAHNSRGTAI